MPVSHSRHVVSTNPLPPIIDRQVAMGRYATTREVLGVALRLLMEREEVGRPNPRLMEDELR